jgi:hypothetical protein
MSLIQLIYVSTASEELGAADLDRILDVSARNNSEKGITGLLLYAGGSFMQVLEGDETAVDTIFRQILQDPRHRDITVLDRAPIAERSFARWSMGFRRLGDAEATTHPAYSPFFQHGFDAAGIGARPGLALEMLKAFARGQR